MTRIYYCSALLFAVVVFDSLVLAVELLAACQGIEFLHPLRTTTPLEKVYELVRSVVRYFKTNIFAEITTFENIGQTLTSVSTKFRNFSICLLSGLGWKIASWPQTLRQLADCLWSSRQELILATDYFFKFLCALSNILLNDFLNMYIHVWFKTSDTMGG